MKNIEELKQSFRSLSPSELQESIKTYELEKTKLLLELGQTTYDQWKENPHSELPESVLRLANVYAKLYASIKRQNEMKKAGEVNACECGAPLQQTDQFCGSCGRPQVEEEQPELVSCTRCEAEVPHKLYCASCGFALSTVYSEGAV